jgi:hypothetical protein
MPMLLGALAVAGCSGDEGGPPGGAAVVLVPPGVSAFQGETVQVQVDLVSLPSDDTIRGYTIDICDGDPSAAAASTASIGEGLPGGSELGGRAQLDGVGAQGSPDVRAGQREAPAGVLHLVEGCLLGPDQEVRGAPKRRSSSTKRAKEATEASSIRAA